MLRSSKGSFLVFLLVCLPVSAFETSVIYGQQASDVVVLRGATVIDGLGNPPLTDATVVVEGDTIQSIRSGQDTDYPAGATVIEVAGKFIIPGLVDTHVHWGAWMGEIYVNHGVTSVLALANVSQEEEGQLTNQPQHAPGFSYRRQYPIDSLDDTRTGSRSHSGNFEQRTGCGLVYPVQRQHQGRVWMGG